MRPSFPPGPIPVAVRRCLFGGILVSLVVMGVLVWDGRCVGVFLHLRVHLLSRILKEALMSDQRVYFFMLCCSQQCSSHPVPSVVLQQHALVGVSGLEEFPNAT